MEPEPVNENFNDINQKEYFLNCSFNSLIKEKEDSYSLYKQYMDNPSDKNLIKNAFKLDNTTSLINSLYLQSLLGTNKFAKKYLLYNYSINENEKEKITKIKNIKSEKEKFINLLSEIEKCNTIDNIIIKLTEEQKIENPYFRSKYFPNKPIDLNDEHQYFYFLNFYINNPQIYIDNEYFISIIQIIKSLYEKNERVLLYSFLNEAYKNKNHSNYIFYIYYLLREYVNNCENFNDVYNKSNKILNIKYLEILYEKYSHFNIFFNKIKFIFIDCLKNFLKSNVIHSGYDILIAKEKLLPINDEFIEYYISHINFKPIFNRNKQYLIYPENLEVIINIAFDFNDLVPIEQKYYNLSYLKKILFICISPLEEYLTYYKSYILKDKTKNIFQIQKQFKNILCTNILREFNCVPKQLNYIFGSFNWDQSYNSFNSEIVNIVKNNDIILGDYFEKFSQANNINEEELEKMLGKFNKKEK